MKLMKLSKKSRERDYRVQDDDDEDDDDVGEDRNVS